MDLKPYEAGELASQHARRVRNVLTLCSVIMVGAGLGWGGHFALTGHHELVLLDIAIVLIGLTIGFLAKGGQNRAASAILIATMWFVLGLLSVFQDIPSAAAPRSVHQYFLPLGVAGYMLFRDEPGWVKHGVAGISLTLFYVLASSNWGLQTDLALPDDIRIPGTWINNLLALGLLYAAMHLMQTDLVAQGSSIAAIRKGLAYQQFVLHFQPQMSANGALNGAEALVRWNHPALGLTPPSEFIPEAEESGLIIPLGYWILEEACAQLVSWSMDEIFENLSLSVNVSAQQFRQADFVSRVIQALDQSGAKPQRLKLELTESMLVNDMDDVILKMTALRERGVRLSLDDFGTGFSSLNYLKRLPLDQLKIDKSFVDELLTDTHDAAIVRTVVTLGHSLGLEVIAEGVETQSQFDFLLELGCRAYQGFLLSKPLPIKEFNAFFIDRATPKQA